MMGRGRKARGERGRGGGGTRRKREEGGGWCPSWLLPCGDGRGSSSFIHAGIILIIITIMPPPLSGLCRGTGAVERQDLVALLEQVTPKVQERAVQVAKDAAWGGRRW